MIEVKELTKRYGERTAVDHISFTVHRGEILGFLGQNGAGKTTTMKMLTCFMSANSGSASIAGFDVFENPIEVKKRIGYLPEDTSGLGFLTGREYLHLIAACHGIPKDREDAQSENLLDLLEMKDRQHALLRTYSAGMVKRILIAGALLPDPNVLLLDEPAANMDPDASNLIRRILRGLADRGRTIFMSTHLLSSSEKTADRVIILSGGRILLDAKLVDLQREHEHEDLEAMYLKYMKSTTSDRTDRFFEKME